MKSYKIEKFWKSEAGLRCVVIMTAVGYRCGYVGVDRKHPLYGHDYSDTIPIYLIKMYLNIIDGEVGKRNVIDLLCHRHNAPRIGFLFDVHGGITYSGNGRKGNYPIKTDLWWFGYDCAHCDDGKDLSVLSEELLEVELKWSTGGILRSVEYCMDECESLAKQLKEVYEWRYK